MDYEGAPSVGLSFNPCFNGFMDKDILVRTFRLSHTMCFNPCFNGFMDKDCELEIQLTF